MGDARVRIGKPWLNVYEGEIDVSGMPRCQCCGAELQPGDKADGMWPYETEYSVCATCEPRFGYTAAEVAHDTKARLNREKCYGPIEPPS